MNTHSDSEAHLTIGSITGELCSYIRRSNTLCATLRPTRGTGTVDVRFTDELDEEAYKALGHKVSIYGILERHPDTHVIKAVRARRIQITDTTQDFMQSGRGI